MSPFTVNTCAKWWDSNKCPPPAGHRTDKHKMSNSNSVWLSHCCGLDRKLMCWMVGSYLMARLGGVRAFRRWDLVEGVRPFDLALSASQRYIGTLAHPVSWTPRWRALLHVLWGDVLSPTGPKVTVPTNYGTRLWAKINNLFILLFSVFP